MSDVLRRLQSRADGVDQFYGSADEELDREAIAEIERLRLALRIIAGEEVRSRPVSGGFYWVRMGADLPPFIAEYQTNNRDRNGNESGPCFWVGTQEIVGTPEVINAIAKPSGNSQ